jgi:hypothetical protein
MTKTDRQHEQSLTWWADHDLALTVACPDPRCEQPAGSPCIRDGGEVLIGPPAHGNRIRNADRAAGIARSSPPAQASPERGPAGMEPADLDMQRRKCNHCHAPILWARTTGDRLMPIDADPHPDGNVLVDDAGGHLVAGVLNPNQAAGARDRGQQLHRHHKLTCPHADRWCRPDRRRARR